MRKILSITGTRADYDLMTPVYAQIQSDKKLSLDLIVCGMHLLEDFKTGLIQIKKDNFGRLHFLSPVRSNNFVFEIFSELLQQLPKIIAKIKPDLILLQGDRGEMLSAAITAGYLNIPIVHMSGGDFSGSIDDSIRAAITKFAHLHLTTNPMSSQRLEHIGERKNRIIEVGEPMIDLIKTMKYIVPQVLAQEFQLDLKKPIIIATQHPVTTESQDGSKQIKITLDALQKLQLQTIFTYPNADPGSTAIIKTLAKFRKMSFLRLVPNLGREKYLSLLKIASVMVGNSSSGILEAPSFKLPVVNIGTRQYGRIRANNVIDVGYNKEEIIRAIKKTLSDKQYLKSLEKCQNPYGDGKTAQKTVKILSRVIISSNLLCKWLNFKGSFLK